jgi:hypothetical protein
MIVGESFKPLRRKVGVLTLLMACAFVAAWVRSFTASDYILIPTKFAGHMFGSDQLGLCWIKAENLDFSTFWGVFEEPRISFEINVAH